MFRIVCPHHVYLALALLFGAIYILASGPFQAPDEYVHFYRAYDISQGNLRAQVFPGNSPTATPIAGGLLPRSVDVSAVAVSAGIPFHPKHKFHVSHIRAELERPLDDTDKVVTEYFPSARLPAISYLPQSLGAFIGRGLELSPLTTLYVARIFNLCAAVLISLVALRNLSGAGWTLCVLALTPMALFLNSSASPDALTNAAALFVFCWFVAATSGRFSLVLRTFAVLLVAVVTMLSGKILYGGLLAIFLPLVLTLYWWRLPTFFTLVSAVAGTLLALYWTSMPLVGMADLRIQADPAAQLRWIIANPQESVAMLARTIEQFWIPWRGQLVGVLGWLDTPLPSRVHSTFGIALGAGILLDVTGRLSRSGFGARSDERTLTLSSFSVLMVLLGSSLSFIGILISVYILFNPVGAPIVHMVQGRYFVPITYCLSLLVFAVPVLRIREGYRSFLKGVLVLALITAHSLSVQTLFKRYYFFAN